MSNGSNRFFNPPLFVENPPGGQPQLTLPASLTFSGTVEVHGELGYSQFAVLLHGGTEIAWKIRDAYGLGGEIHQGQSNETASYYAGHSPGFELWLSWNGGGTCVPSVSSSGVDYGFAYTLCCPPIPITATGSVRGSFLPNVGFDHWKMDAMNMTVTGRDSAELRYDPMDGTRVVNELGDTLEHAYAPVGIPWSEGEVTVRVDAKGDYVFLSYQDFEFQFDYETEELSRIPGRYDSGMELTVPYGKVFHDEYGEISFRTYVKLVYDESRSTFDELTDTVYVTITGGGKSKTIPVILKKMQILLGETKYYQAMPDMANPRGLVFKEMSEISGWQSGLASADFTVAPVYPTSKLGVYYEFKDNNGVDLEHNLIRLIGRYWQQDTTYMVRLSATSGARSGNTVIEVTKPARLLTTGQSPSYRFSRDVFDNEINIDDTCIVYGGRYGIPPQFLKGQMLKEAGKIDLPGDRGFAPSYRYEPFNKDTQRSLAWKGDSRYNGGLWVVDTARVGHEMGTGKDVPEHRNVQDMPYPRSPKSVWDILSDNSELVNTGSTKEHRVYGKRLSNGKMVFPSEYTSVCAIYNEFLNVTGSWNSLLSPKSREEIAREKMIEYLRDKWENGAKNMVAQTRLASSYGLLQALYSTAVEMRGYPSLNSNISPEDLNVTTINMTYSLEYMKQLLQQGLSASIEERGEWPNGFEYWFKNYVWWPRWNAHPTYPRIVYPYTQRFLPQGD